MIASHRSTPPWLKPKRGARDALLEPRKMMGELSEAMLFDIGYANDLTPVLAVLETPIPNGASAG